MMASLAMGLTPKPGMAQAPDPEFRVIDLGLINNSNSTGKSEAFGINNRGDVVGESTLTDSGVRPFLWVPAPSYLILSEVMHDLHALSDVSVTEEGSAFDINMRGQIAGLNGIHSVFTNDVVIGEAAVWETDVPPSAFPFRLRLLGTLGGDVSIAFAINEADPPIVVGGADFDGFANCIGPPMRAYQVALPTDPNTPVVLVQLANTSLDDESRVNDVNNDGLPLMVGFAGECGTGEDKDATQWVDAAVAFLPQPPSNPTTLQYEARGTNDFSEIVGFAQLLPMNPPVPIKAFYWSSPTAIPVNLSELIGFDISFAQSINNAVPRQIVGRDEEMNSGILWTKDGTGQGVNEWTAVELNQLIAPTCGSILRANDINDSGWIVGQFSNSSGELHAYLLIPFVPPACPGDTNGDGNVDVTDLLDVLGMWGTCAGGSLCNADFNASCMVDVTDLLSVLGNWGPDCGAQSGGGIPQSVNDCLSMYSDTDLQCKCIERLCLAGAIPAEECGPDPSCN